MRPLRAIPFLAVLVASSCLQAQLRGAPVVRAGAATLGPRSFVPASHPTAIGRPAIARRLPRSTLFLPFFYSDLADFDQLQPQPQVIVVHEPPPAPEPVRSEAPILIEWQGDRYVRMSGDDRQAVSASPGSPSPPPRETPSATLIFRDGTRQEVASYTIVDGVLYANSDYWTSGKWTQPIPLSQLDIARTIASNQQKGVRFPLPGGAHEVVVRP
jgi:hypothetical protein